MPFQKPVSSPMLSSGVKGLDQILRGGFPRNRLHLIEGEPGTGKTSLGMQFLMEGARHGESGLYVSLSETVEEIEVVAESHGWNLEGIKILELCVTERALSPDSQYTMFHASEVELAPILKSVLDEVEMTKPTRVVFDSLSEMRLLSRDSLKYRRQILGLKQFFAGRKSTVLLLEDGSGPDRSAHELQSLCHGVVQLQQFTLDYGAKRRRMSVAKMRGVDYRSGFHDFDIKTGGIVIYPRLVASHQSHERPTETVASGAPSLDSMLGGGLERGTSTLIVGPAGVGKSSLAVQYAVAIANGGEKAAVYTFDEVLATLLSRTNRLGLCLKNYVAAGSISLTQVDPAELAPGAFIEMVRSAVENENVRAVVIDSLNGYLNAMSNERFLITQMHELFSFLNQKGVLTILVVSQNGLVGSRVESPIDISYLSDNVILLRYFEAAGLVRKAISVVKKRSSEHENSIREFRLTSTGVELGGPLHEFQGILSGNPVYFGAETRLHRGSEDAETP